jgi:hypothetical protein
MSNSKSIGGSYGSGPITAESVGIGQSPGGPVGGYQTDHAPQGAGVPPPQGAVASPPQATPKSNRPGSGGKNVTHTRNDGKAQPPPSRTRG